MKRKNNKQNVFWSCYLFIHEHLTNESSEGNEDAYSHSSCGHIEDDSGGLNLGKKKIKNLKESDEENSLTLRFSPGVKATK